MICVQFIESENFALIGRIPVTYPNDKRNSQVTGLIKHGGVIEFRQGRKLIMDYWTEKTMVYAWKRIQN